MKKVFLSLAIAISAFAIEPIVSVDWLSKNLDNKNLRIVEVSSQESYNLAHIPNATNTDIDKWRSDNGTYAVLKDIKTIEQEIRSHNIDKKSEVVIYADIQTPRDFLKTSYIFWALHYVGIENVALLDGGKQAWTKANGTFSQAKASIKQSDFKAKVNPKILASKEYVTKNLGKIPMIDARPSDNYLGITPTNGVKRDGHIKGAMSYSWNYSVDKEYMLKDVKKLDTLFKDGYNLDKKKEVLVYCTGGLETSYNYFVLRGVLGYKNVRLYDASMKEWGNLDTTPMTQYKYESFKK
ncbi:MAG: rhodanese-like domain-containing protein [Sulfurimonadaceae bacterium]|jgi:thiosulfate/3-mercaptopyruvate sulfurtransferase|nr:rhodanese-like domain-containing protein [Sulfurimonadaceae bacterium]